MRALLISTLVWTAACSPEQPSPVRLDEAQAPPSAAAPASAAPQPAWSGSAAARPRLQLEDADLPELIRAIGAVTGKRFVVSGALPPIKATLVAPDTVSAEEAYQAFLTILASNGLTVVPRGRFHVIMRSPGFGGP